MSLDATGCPLWIHPNADETGYYRWRLPEPELLGLVTAGRERLTAPEEVALPGHLDALLVAGQLDAGTYLEVLGHLAQSRPAPGRRNGDRRVASRVPCDG